MDKLENQKCPVCFKDTLTLTEENTEVPYFGRVFIFSMKCSNAECDYSMSDVETEERKDPTKYTIEINSDKDMNIRVVKSSTGIVRIPQLKVDIEPGVASIGYVTNIEGVLDRVKKIIEEERDTTEDDDIKENAKKLLKKIWKIKLGDLPIKIIIEDESGNSAIISEKAKIENLKIKGN